MNKIARIGASVLLAAQWQVASSSAAETMVQFRPDRQLEGRPVRGAEPPSKRSKQGAVPLTRESVSAAVDARIRALFDRAADPAIQLVTLSSAEKSGVGYFIGQFADMDRDSDGALSFKEIKGFFDAQSPIAKPESKAQQGIEKQEIQIIE